MQKFESRKNAVVLLDGGVIRKTFSQKSARDNEARLLTKLDGVLAPRLLAYGENFLDISFVEGKLLLDEYLVADEKKAVALATSLAKTITYIYSVTGEITFDENFRNYIIAGADCVRVDFEETTSGTLESYVAKLAAFAALYEVADEVKSAFIKTLAEKTDADICTLTAAFEEELKFLSDRWKTAYPAALYDRIIRKLYE